MKMTATNIKICEILVGFLFAINVSQCSSQGVMFSLKDSSVNEVIFAGDVNVTLICEVTIDVTVINVTIITNNGQIVATKEHDTYIEYVIPKVTMHHTGNFSCLVTYVINEDERTSRTEVKLLSLLVNEGGPVCFRNGSGIGKPYKVEDILLLSCYCKLTEVNCIWSRTIVGSGTAKTIKSIEEHQFNNKIVQRIVVGPLNNGPDMWTRYDCFQGSSSAERCSIGPALNSSYDSIFSSTPTTVATLQYPGTEKLAEDNATVLPSSQVNNYVKNSTVATSHVQRPQSNTSLTLSAIPPASVTHPELIFHTLFTKAFGTSSQFNSDLNHYDSGSTVESTSNLDLEFNLSTDESNSFILYVIFAVVGGVILLTALSLSMLIFLLCKRRGKKSYNTAVTQNVVNVNQEPHDNANVRSSFEFSDYFDDDGFRDSFASSVDGMTLKYTDDHVGHGTELSTFSGDPYACHKDEYSE